MLLGLKQSTPNIMIYAELGITPLSLSIQNRILNFCAKIINGKPNKISVVLKKSFLNFIRETYTSHHRSHMFSLPEIKQHCRILGVLKQLITCWLSNTKRSQLYMINFTQSWKCKIFESSKCINYTIYKDTLKFEAYLKVLPISQLK